MRAVIMRRHGGPEVLDLEEVATPRPADGESLVRVEAVGIEPGLDVRTRQHATSWPVALPHVLGASFAGVVQETAGGGPLSPGRRVAVAPFVACLECERCRNDDEGLCDRATLLGVHRWGGYAEYAVVPTRNLVAIPDGVGFEEVAAAVVSYSTAWNMLVRRADVRPAQTVLVVGATGAVGRAAAQIASIRGARVIVAARDLARLETAYSDVPVLGAVAIHNLSTRVRHLAPEGVDVVIDTVGAATMAASVESLRRGGRVAFCGAPSGADVRLSLRDLYRKNLSLLGTALSTADDLRQVVSLLGDREVTPIVARTFRLDQAREAHAGLAERSPTGKYVILPSQ